MTCLPILWVITLGNQSVISLKMVSGGTTTPKMVQVLLPVVVGSENVPVR